MVLAVDTNILLDVLIPNAAYLESSLNCLLKMGRDDEIVICESVYAELGSQFLSQDKLNDFLNDTSIRLLSSNEKTLFEASNAWKMYALRKKEFIVCPACGKRQKATCDFCKEMIPRRRHILSDFLIGAHAKMQTNSLITRDRGFYRTYFKDLNVLNPLHPHLCPLSQTK